METLPNPFVDSVPKDMKTAFQQCEDILDKGLEVLLKDAGIPRELYGPSPLLRALDAYHRMNAMLMLHYLLGLRQLPANSTIEEADEPIIVSPGLLPQ